MSHPNWRQVLAAGAGDAAERQRVLVHLRECAACRRHAVEAAPDLLFATLPEYEATPDEVAGLRRAVDVLRRHRPAVGPGRLTGRAAAGLLLGAVLLATLPRPGGQAPAAVEIVAAEPLPGGAAARLAPAGARVYGFEREGWSFVLMVDESFDVE